MRALVVGHDHVASIEHLGGALEARGYELTTMTVVPEQRFEQPDVRVEFPDPAAWDLVVTLGAPWPHGAISSWAGDEVAFLRGARDAGTSVLGVCFGAQQLARALGGSTGPLSEGRIGWRAVAPHAPGIAAGPWFQWHADRIVAPPGATVLAGSVDGVEAFRVGRCAGVQFHPEMTPTLLEAWLSLPGGPPPGLDVEALRTDTAELTPDAAAGVPALLAALLGGR